MADGECCGGSGACRTEEAHEPRLHEELLVRYLRGVENFDPRVFDLTDEQTDQVFETDAGAGLWPVRVLMGHLADAEMLFTQRIRRTIAEDGPVLELWDQDAFIAGGIYGSELRPPVAGFVAAIHTMRRWTAELLLSLTPAQWERRAMHPELGEMTVLDIVTYTTEHLERHNGFLQLKLDAMFGVCEETGGGGCGCGAGGCCREKDEC